MSWREEITIEMQRARAAATSGNAGKARTSARRAVGIALTEHQRKVQGRNYGTDVIGQLRGLAADSTVDDSVRAAAERLQ
ncbi:MAG TPA: hypothetical protein VMH23_15735, partial [Bacteroidota bacterium]|nr:hypothetical protein [Bacteroidota bacterium]